MVDLQPRTRSSEFRGLDWLRRLTKRRTSRDRRRPQPDDAANTAMARDAGAGVDIRPANTVQVASGGRHFTFRELEIATGGFSEDMIIGEGCFGQVYAGRLPSGQGIAVKRQGEAGVLGNKQFDVEVSILNMLWHPNIVRLLGICSQGKEHLAVLELATKGSLRGQLDNKESPLSWQERCCIARDAARGLCFLHYEMEPPVVHRDIKTANILVTGENKGLLADFGLARRMQSPGGDKSFVMLTPEASRIVGTFGYVAPEYAHTGLFNEKSDVYSFGVVLLELLTSETVVSVDRPDDCRHLADWLASKDLIEIREVLDPAIADAPGNEIQIVNALAVACCKHNFWERPRMKEVVGLLESVCSTYWEAPVESPVRLHTVHQHLSASASLGPARSVGSDLSTGTNVSFNSTLSASSTSIPASESSVAVSAASSGRGSSDVCEMLSLVAVREDLCRISFPPSGNGTLDPTLRTERPNLSRPAAGPRLVNSRQEHPPPVTAPAHRRPSLERSAVGPRTHTYMGSNPGQGMCRIVEGGSTTGSLQGCNPQGHALGSITQTLTHNEWIQGHNSVYEGDLSPEATVQRTCSAPVGGHTPSEVTEWLLGGSVRRSASAGEATSRSNQGYRAQNRPPAAGLPSQRLLWEGGHSVVMPTVEEPPQRVDDVVKKCEGSGGHVGSAGTRESSREFSFGTRADLPSVEGMSMVSGDVSATGRGLGGAVTVGMGPVVEQLFRSPFAAEENVFGS